MKKMLKVILFITLSLGCFAQGLNIKAGLDFDGVLETDADGKIDINSNTSIDVSVELMLMKQFELGAGFTRYSELDAKDKVYEGVKEFDFLPLYLQGKYNFAGGQQINPYIISKYGVALINEGDLAEGYSESNYDLGADKFIAYGIGVEYNNYIIEILYEEVNTVFELDTEELFGETIKMNPTYSRITLSVGFNLGRQY